MPPGRAQDGHAEGVEAAVQALAVEAQGLVGVVGVRQGEEHLLAGDVVGAAALAVGG
jgi:hypothetical protein